MSGKWLCKAVLGAVLVVVAASVAVAAPIVDGNVQKCQEGYSLYWEILPSKQSCPATPAAILAMSETADKLYMGLILPKEYVDNTYGANTVGWGGPNKHTFSQLVGSDAVKWNIKENNTEILDFTLDYLGTRKDGSFITGLTKYDPNKANANGEVATGSPSDVPDAGSSLYYNMNLLNGLNYTVNSPNNPEQYNVNPLISEWIYEVMYEWTIDKSVFGDMTLLSATGLASGIDFVFTIENLHTSPDKTDAEWKNIMIPHEASFKCPPPEQPIPEPATMLLLGSGLAGVGLAGWRRRRQHQVS